MNNYVKQKLSAHPAQEWYSLEFVISEWFWHLCVCVCVSVLILSRAMPATEVIFDVARARYTLSWHRQGCQALTDLNNTKNKVTHVCIHIYIYIYIPAARRLWGLRKFLISRRADTQLVSCRLRKILVNRTLPYGLWTSILAHSRLPFWSVTRRKKFRIGLSIVRSFQKADPSQLSQTCQDQLLGQNLPAGLISELLFGVYS